MFSGWTIYQALTWLLSGLVAVLVLYAGFSYFKKVK